MAILRELFLLFDVILFQFKLIFPYWMAGVAVGSVLSVFAAAKIKALAAGLSTERYRLDLAFLAALLGIASPVCMYGTIPLIASLGRKGVPQYILAAFMTSSILLNPNLFLQSFVLGTPVAILRLCTCIIAGLAAGALVRIFFRDRNLFNFESFEEKKKCREGQSTLRYFMSDLNKAITITAPYFLAGIFLTALFDRYFPKQLIYLAFGSNKGFGVLLAASLGVPVYVCGGGTIPLIRVWLQAGMSPGSALAFMITGPATKLTNLSAVKVILGVRNFTFYIVFHIFFAVITGYATDFIYGLIR
jgi:uncharacterized protein